jgi:hypothetical protein
MARFSEVLEQLGLGREGIIADVAFHVASLGLLLLGLLLLLQLRLTDSLLVFLFVTVGLVDWGFGLFLLLIIFGDRWGLNLYITLLHAIVEKSIHEMVVIVAGTVFRRLWLLLLCLLLGLFCFLCLLLGLFCLLCLLFGLFYFLLRLLRLFYFLPFCSLCWFWRLFSLLSIRFLFLFLIFLLFVFLLLGWRRLFLFRFLISLFDSFFFLLFLLLLSRFLKDFLLEQDLLLDIFDHLLVLL